MKTRLILAIVLSCQLTFGQKLETVLQSGHLSVIKTVAYSPDGKYLISGSRDKTIILWDVASGRQLRSFVGHTNTINDLDFATDGRTFVSSSADGYAIRWDVLTGEILGRYSKSDEYMTSVDLSSDGKYLLTGGFQNKVLLWDLTENDTIRSFPANPEKGLGYGINAYFDQEGENIVIGNDNRTLTSYTLNGEKRFEYKPVSGWCGGCATFIDFSEDLLLSASNNSDLQTHNLESGEVEQIIIKNLDDSREVKLAPDGRTVLYLKDDSLNAYTLKGEQLYSIQTADKVNDMAFSPDGKFFVTADDDELIKMYNASNGKLYRTLGGYRALLDKAGLDYNDNSRWDYYIKKYTDLKNGFDISPDGNFLAKAKVGPVVRIWDIKSGQMKTELRGHEKAVLSVSYSSDGRWIATGGADRKVKLWDANTGDLIRTFDGHREVVFDVAFNESNTKLISGSWDGSARIWDIETGQQLTALTFENSSPYRVLFYKNDLYALVVGLDKSIKIYELDSKSIAKEFIGHTDVIHNIDLHNNQLFSVSWDGRIKTWDIASELQVWRNANSQPLYAVAVDRTNQLVATAGAACTIDLLNLENGSLITSLSGHQSAITDLKFAANGNWLISSSEDGMIKIWDVVQKEVLVSYIVFDNTDWIAVNEAGYFTGSVDAFDKLAFVKGLASYDIDQFFSQFYQPELLKRSFAKKSTGSSIEEQLTKSPPPKVEIIAPHHQETVKAKEIDVLLKIEDQGGGADILRLYHNAKLVKEVAVELKNGKGAVSEKLDLIPGVNIIEALASNKSGIESSKKQVEITLEGKKNTNLYLFAIGINHYENESLNLNYARADAEGFIDIIKQRSKNLFDKVEVIPLFDEAATKENILNQLSLLAKRANPNDVLFFYYAGHGSMVDDSFYFVPTENVKLYSEDKLRESGIRADELQQALREIAALKQLLIIDACQSGGSVELLAQRGAPEEKALAQLSRSTGIHVLAAAGSEQFATEFTSLGHGIFTYVLLEALSGKADGAPHDGKVTIYELKSYLDDQVPEFSKKHKGKMQFPHTFSRGQDFPIIIK